MSIGVALSPEGPTLLLRMKPNVDSEGHLARAYGATDRTLTLIRPDGYIALISDAGDLTAISEYLAKISGCTHLAQMRS